MPRCGCGGQTCGCAVQAGSGVSVTGTGTAANPFKISVDPFSLGLAKAINVSTSSTIEFSKTGSGGSGDPVVITGSVILRAPDNTRWTLQVSSAGALSAVRA